MEFFIIVVLFVFGTAIGSFLNVVILRTPLKQQFTKGRSHCMSCDHVLGWYDLFPVLSWVSLRGKCRYCKAKISPRYALVEMLTGLSFAGAFFVLDITPELAFSLILFPVLICLSFFDLDTGEIEYWCPITIASLGIIALVLSFTDILPTVWYHHLIGAVIVSIPFAVLAILGMMGGGDVQLMAGAGLLLGFNIIPAALIGIVLGAIFGVIMKLRTKPTISEIVYDDDPTLSDLPTSPPTLSDLPTSSDADPTDSDEPTPPEDGTSSMGTVIRFGPFLAIGIAIAYLFGDIIINWYLSFLS
ncbi:MAG: prepilin peptidase [Oscillospiraceae bacterium]|nr:prepilin peptidase [Oscillospiraceae bacterium]